MELSEREQDEREHRQTGGKRCAEGERIRPLRDDDVREQDQWQLDPLKQRLRRTEHGPTLLWSVPSHHTLRRVLACDADERAIERVAQRHVLAIHPHCGAAEREPTDPTVLDGGPRPLVPYHTREYGTGR